MKLKPHSAYAPLSALYGAAIAARNSLYDRGILASQSIGLPIICVGNAIAGGSGKTPFVHALVLTLQRLERQPAILLRGYGGTTEGPHLVTELDTAHSVGDEAILHQTTLREVPIVVSRDRYAGARLIESNQLAGAIVMDDGYQHRALARSTNLLLLDISDPESIARWGRGRLLPAGWLREPLSAALRRAQGVVLVDKGDPLTFDARQQEAIKLLPLGCTPITFQLRPHLLRDIVTGAIAPVGKFAGGSVVAATAIAHPDSFFSTLAAAGYTIVTKHPFPDHYLFSGSDVERLLNSGHPVVVTEKDETKLRSLISHRGRVFSLVLRGAFSDDASRNELLRLLN